MKKIRIVLLLFSIVSIVPLITYFYVKARPTKQLPIPEPPTPVEMEEYVSYERAWLEIGEEIAEQGVKKQLRGNIARVKESDAYGPDTSLNDFVSICGVTLSQYDGWRLLGSDAEARDLNETKRMLNEKWAKLGERPYDPEKLIRGSVGAAPDYVPKCEWHRTPGRNCRIILRVSDVVQGMDVFFISRDFLHPVDVDKEKMEMEKQNIRMTKEYTSRLEKIRNTNEQIKRKERLIEKCGLTGAILFLLNLLGFLGISVFLKIRFNNLPVVMEKLEELVSSGHFIAAEQLVGLQLKLFPQYSDLVAFSERLEDFTGGDPKKAQVAFVEGLKLKKIIEKMQSGGLSDVDLLPSNDVEKIKGLIPHNPELQSSMSMYKQLEKKKMQIDELTPGLRECRRLVEQKKLSSAFKLVDELLSGAPDSEEARNQYEEIRADLEKEKSMIEEAERMIADGEVSESSRILDKVLVVNSESSEATILRLKIESASARNSLLLSCVEADEMVLMILDTSAVIGRSSDESQPDVAVTDKLVSRRHLRVSIVDDKVIAEDLRSVNGTTVNGVKIEAARLSTGDKLKLGGVVEYSVNIHSEQSGEVGSVFLEYEKGSIILLASSINVVFTSEGLHFDPQASSGFFFNGRVLLFRSNNRCCLAGNGETLESGGFKYTVSSVGK